MKLRGAQKYLLAFVAIALVALAAWRFNWISLTERPSARSLLISRLTEVSGQKGTNCGVITSSEPAVLGCVQSALDQKAPFWFVEEMQGIDNYFVIGTASSGKGGVSQIFYGSSSTMTTGGLPQFGTTQCANPSIVKGQYSHFSCDGL